MFFEASPIGFLLFIEAVYLNGGQQKDYLLPTVEAATLGFTALNPYTPRCWGAIVGVGNPSVALPLTNGHSLTMQQLSQLPDGVELPKFASHLVVSGPRCT